MIGRDHGIPLPGTDGFLLDEAAWEDHDVLEAEHTAFISACLDGAPSWSTPSPAAAPSKPPWPSPPAWSDPAL